MKYFNKVGLAASALLVLFSYPAFAGEKTEVTDITGRKVTVSLPVEHVILGEGRQIYFTAALDTTLPSSASSAGATTSSGPISTFTTSISRSSPRWLKSRPSAA